MTAATECESIAARVSKVLPRIAEHAAVVDRQRQFPRASLTALAAAGLWGLTVPTEFGGLGGGPAEFVDVVAQIGGACGSTGMVYLMRLAGTAPIVAAGSPEQKRRWLPDIAAGRTLTTLAFSEPGSGAHFYFPTSRAVAVNGHAELACDKSFVTSAGEADLYIVSTGAATAASPAESELYAVPARPATGRITLKNRWEGLGFHGNASSPMSFAGVPVGEPNRIGPPRAAWAS